MMFKGTKRRPSTLHISKELDSVGASYNAFTGKSYTGYYAKVPAENFSLAVDLIHDMVFHSLYAPAEMARERKVIIEEINMYEDNPLMHIEDLLEEKLLEGNPVGWNIAGSRETMTKMKRADVIKFRDAYYTPSRVVLAAAGKLPDNAKKMLEAKFGKIRGPKDSPEFIPYKNESCPCCWPKAVVQYKDTQQVQLAFGFLSPGLRDEKKDLLADVLATVLGGSMSSRLFISVRERKGLAYFVRASQGSYEDIGAFSIRAGLDKSRLPLASKVIFDELRSIKKKGPTVAELKLAKNYLKGKMKLGLEDSSSRADFYARQELLLDKIESPESYYKKIDGVTAKELQSMANEILYEENLTVAGIGPFKTEKNLMKEVGL
jgi:predicted Zn-dependent peptidase